MDAKTPQGLTSLHLAIGPLREHEAKYASIVKLLLHAGAAVDATDKEGNTSMHRAAKFGYASVIRQLIDHSANCEIKNARGLVPSDLASDAAVLALIRPRVQANTVDPGAMLRDLPKVASSQPQDDRVRIQIVEKDGSVREFYFESDGTMTEVKPTDVKPTPDRIGADPLPRSTPRDSSPYTLSESQSTIQSRLGDPDCFNILLIEEDLGTKVVRTRLEKWTYLRSGKLFAFVDGQCVSIKNIERPKFKSKIVAYYRPSQFYTSMTKQDVTKRLGSHFKSLALQDHGFQNDGLRDLELLTDGTVTLGFQNDRLVSVQSIFRSLPKP
ncbi:MAG: ankyrin repeat domain-containing protein [Planctomycetota bacterium]